MSRRILFLGMLLALMWSSGMRSYGQSSEAQQLLLNVEKLSQLKNILADMKKGYQVLSQGYGAVKNIAQGNFSLHEVFLDGLMMVSPEVKKYHKVGDIVRYQLAIVSEYKAALSRLSRSNMFSVSELDYLARVYKQLFEESLVNLDRLLMVVTSSKLRMRDDERLSAIDRIYADTVDKLSFLRAFNRKADVLRIMRVKERSELVETGAYFGIK
ncbi:TerB family tellurite resistance protein [Pedobacter deserti]|uniref:TerB family tellurite resistance protein n=1 Tax=Pedobacter deserti TaxID=2817382 RepID=UPI00210B31C8|nr:TerB family tellurite resistance protein [Pedobacter sp. SYSU D00382]